MNTRLPTYEDMMVVIRALIAKLADEAPKAESSVQWCAKTQDIIVMALAYLGDRDLLDVVSENEAKPLVMDHLTLPSPTAAEEGEKNIYKYFDTVYVATHGKSSKAAFEQADQTIAATSLELIKMHRGASRI